MRRVLMMRKQRIVGNSQHNGAAMAALHDNRMWNHLNDHVLEMMVVGNSALFKKGMVICS
ncbi:hypothetical protein ACFX4S_00300 [Kosakonia sp. YIM B13605]|uniref:hypothetical protein n=1 Tax=Kosakonia TaxID=1330547 RepID=UPI0028AD3EEE|nr:hypothetical protein [Kosakonia sacchari]